MHTVYPTPDQRKHPQFCKVYAKRTPIIPFHNGMTSYWVGNENDGYKLIQNPCIGCGKVEDHLHDHPNWSHTLAYGPCTKPV